MTAAADLKRCDVCGEPMTEDERGLRHVGCRAEHERRRFRDRRTEARELDWHHPARAVTRQQTNVRVTRKLDAEAWLRTDDARWSSDPELRRQRQAAGLCVVCALARQDGRHWCCSRAHEKLRRHTLHLVLGGG